MPTQNVSIASYASSRVWVLGSVFYQILSIMSEWYRKSLSEKRKIAQAKLKEQGRYQGGKVQYGKDLCDNGVLIDCENRKKKST